jgi:hypothetical protein
MYTSTSAARNYEIKKIHLTVFVNITQVAQKIRVSLVECEVSGHSLQRIVERREDRCGRRACEDETITRHLNDFLEIGLLTALNKQ